MVELRETIKAFFTGAAWNRRRMNNSTRAVWALERLYSFSLSHPASGRFSSREIYETSHRELSDISRTYAVSNVNWNVSFILLCHLLQRMKSVIEIYKARNPTSSELNSWNKLRSMNRKRKFHIIWCLLYQTHNVNIIIIKRKIIFVSILFEI